MPLSEKQLKVLAFPYSKYQTLICDGAVRSGKTSVMSVAFFDWIMREFDRCNFIVLGYTQGSAIRNVIDPYMSMSYARERYQMDFSRSKGELTIRRGGKVNTVYVFGADNQRSFMKIQGVTCAGCFVDETALCDRDAFNQALARCSVDGARFWFNCNPSYPKHWFREDWILRAQEQNALHLHFTMDDNPSLSDETKARYDRQYSGVFHDRYVKGLWVIAEGLVYQLDEVAYKCSRKEAEGNSRGLWYVSCDYGITNPFAALLWRLTASGAYLVDEYHFDSRREGRRKTDAEHYEAIERLCAGRRIEAIVIDPSASSMKEEIWRRGRFDVIDAENDVLQGIATTDQMLHDGTVKVCSECYATIAEFGLYRWDDKKERDAVIKENDHAMDALRYFCNSVVKYEVRGYS